MWKTHGAPRPTSEYEVIRQDTGDPEVIQSKAGYLRKVIKRRKALEEDLKKTEKI